MLFRSSDVEALLVEQRDKLDEAYIWGWLKEFAEVLENADMLPRYQRLLTRARAIS